MNRKEALERELQLGLSARRAKDPAAEFSRLERAHILSQPNAWDHTRVHLWMLGFALRQKRGRETLGLLFRLFDAAPASWSGRYPLGNTGGSNVSAFAAMPIPKDLEPHVNP